MRNVAAMRIAIFPNGLTAANSLFDGGYILRRVFLIAGQEPKYFSPRENLDVVFDFQDLTIATVDTAAYMANYIKFPPSKNHKITFFNHHCQDISKAKMGALNQQVFGYNLMIDPLTHRGQAVCKSEENATHDGYIVDCPLTAAEIFDTKNYSIVVKNDIGNQVVDYRLFYCRGLLGFVLEKRKPIEERFVSTFSSVRIAHLSEKFSADEIDKMEALISRLGADYGELDVLRDRETNRIYVIDFAKTPWGLPLALSVRQRAHLLEQMTIAYIDRMMLAVWKDPGADRQEAH